MLEKIQKNKRGFSLIEMIVYLSLMTIITLVIVQSIIVVLKSNKESSNNNAIENNAVFVLESIKRETRRAKEIDITNSNLANGEVQFNIFLEDGSQSNSKISLQGNGSVNVFEGGNLFGPISTPDSEIIFLSFKQIKTSKSEALKTVVTIKSGEKTETFYSTNVLRGSY